MQLTRAPLSCGCSSVSQNNPSHSLYGRCNMLQRLQCKPAVPGLPLRHTISVGSHPDRTIRLVTARYAAEPEASVTRADIMQAAHDPLSHQQLLDLGAQLVKCWFGGIAKGPHAVQEELQGILDKDVVILADRVRSFHNREGFTDILAELERGHLEYHRSEHWPLLFAASESAQRVYALVEGRYQDVGAMPGHPATFRISKVHHILAMEVYDGCIVRLWLRRQLTEEDKDELLHEPLSCYPAPFPRDELRHADPDTHHVASGRMTHTVRSWWQAWSAPEPAAGGGGSSSDVGTVSGSNSSIGSKAFSSITSKQAADAAANNDTHVPASSNNNSGRGAVTASGSNNLNMSWPGDDTPSSTAGAAAPAASDAVPTAGSSSSSSSGNPMAARRLSRGRPDPATVAGMLLAPGFKMWDAYGLWPSMRTKGRRHLSREAALHYLQKLQYGHHIHLQVIDVAVAEGSLACFTHWQAVLKPKWSGAAATAAAGAAAAAAAVGLPAATAPAAAVAAAAAAAAAADGASPASSAAQPSDSAISGATSGSSCSSSTSVDTQGLQPNSVPAQLEQQPAKSPSSSLSSLSADAQDDGSFVVDGIEVDMFNEQLQLQDIWVFRGPIGPKEVQLFLEYDRQQAAAEAAQAASAQEAIRAARRAERERQMQELMAWMNQYQQQWGDYVKHVQKALEKQQQAAKEQTEKLMQQGMQQLQQQQQQRKGTATVQQQEANMQHQSAGAQPPVQQQQQQQDGPAQC